jgi:predicted O-methyltransferase YrrM
MGAKRVVDFATSIGMSAIYFAAAMRANGGGTVIGSELVPERVKHPLTFILEASQASRSAVIPIRGWI